VVWDEVCKWLSAQPERNGRSVFDELQRLYPGQFANGQLRTLQRHIAVWRAKTVLDRNGWAFSPETARVRNCRWKLDDPRVPGGIVSRGN
jgi:hypothetical protein